MKLFNFSFLLVLLLASSLCLFSVVRAEDNAEEEAEEDAVINEESTAETAEDAADIQTAAETEADETDTEEKVLSSPFVKTNVLFIQPESSELPAGKLVKMLIGFQNNGSSSFLVESIDGSFRYPQDFSYHIQNFSVFDFNKMIDADREATFDYMFTPSETFSSRQFGLTINLRYRNLEGKSFVNAVFNETVNIVEPDEGLDGETFFLYVFLVAVLLLLLFGAYHFLSTFKKKSRTSKPSNAPATKLSSTESTSDANGIDYTWIPKEHLQTNKSPKVSPRQRKTKNVAAAGNSSNDEQ